MQSWGGVPQAGGWGGPPQTVSLCREGEGPTGSFTLSGGAVGGRVRRSQGEVPGMRGGSQATLLCRGVSRQLHSVGGRGGSQAVSLCGRGGEEIPGGGPGGGVSLCRTCSPRITSSD